MNTTIRFLLRDLGDIETATTDQLLERLSLFGDLRFEYSFQHKEWWGELQFNRHLGAQCRKVEQIMGDSYHRDALVKLAMKVRKALDAEAKHGPEIK